MPLKPREKKAVKDVLISMRLTTELRDRLQRASKKLNGKPVTEIMRELVEEGLAREGF